MEIQCVRSCGSRHSWRARTPSLEIKAILRDVVEEAEEVEKVGGKAMEEMAVRDSDVIWYWRFQRWGERGGSVSDSSKIATVRSWEAVARI